MSAYISKTIPSESVNFISRANDKAARVLQKTHNVNINADTSIVSTVSAIGLEETITELASLAKENNGFAECNYMNILTIKIDLRKSDEGEKEGNLGISFIPGPIAKMAIKDDEITEDECEDEE